MKGVIVFALFALLHTIDTRIILTSCARMDVPGLSKVAQALCVTSCKYQNCGTGHCEKRRGRPVCVCSRCASGGGSWPNV
uniref:INVERT_DEFENSINS domain-containing protein n=1 Tax=Ascaris lumbricoides TaxID=6252 RepID=A0A0M3IC68_ASCLU